MPGLLHRAICRSGASPKLVSAAVKMVQVSIPVCLEETVADRTFDQRLTVVVL